MEAQKIASSPEKYITPRSQRAYTAEERRLILHVYGVLRLENPEMQQEDATKRVAELTGASRAAVERLKMEFDIESTVVEGKKSIQVD